MDDGAKELGINVFAWFVAFHLLYRASKVFSPMIAPETYSNLRKKDPNEADYWDSCVVSAVHGIFISALGFYVLMEEDVIGGGYTYETPLSRLCTYIITGYLFNDMILCLTHRMWPGLGMLLFHHILGVYCTTYSLYTHYGSGLVVLTVVVEATAPFVNGRWFLDKLGWRNTTLYLVNGMIITVTWFLLRILFMGWYLYIFAYEKWGELVGFDNKQLMFVVLAGFVGGYGLQVIWFQKILSGMLKVLSSSKSSSKKL